MKLEEIRAAMEKAAPLPWQKGTVLSPADWAFATVAMNLMPQLLAMAELVAENVEDMKYDLPTFARELREALTALEAE